MLRLFVCAWVPEELKEKIINFQEEIKNIPIKAKFVERENLHLTITFLGNIREEEVGSLKKKLDMITKDTERFQINLSGLKVIPNENYVRVLGISIKDNGEMADLIKNIGNAVGGKYYETNKLTLCRVKTVKDKNNLRDFIEKNHDVKIGDFEVKNIALVKSVLSRNGPLYETVEKFELK